MKYDPYTHEQLQFLRQMPDNRPAIEGPHGNRRGGLAVAGMLILIALMLTGCERKSSNDQCMRREIFMQCLSAVPKGPERTGLSNDWAEVVSECGSASYYQSLRQSAFITSDCRPN